MILTTPDELDEFNEAFRGSSCIWTNGRPFEIGMNNNIRAVDTFGPYFKEYLISVTPTEKALRYLYKLVGEDYDNHR